MTVIETLQAAIEDAHAQPDGKGLLIVGHEVGELLVSSAGFVLAYVDSQKHVKKPDSFLTALRVMAAQLREEVKA